MSNGPRGYGNGSGSFRNNFNNGYQYQNGQGSRPDYQNAQYAKKKHSGAKTVRSRKPGFEGVEFISAWNYSRRRGMITCFISEYKKTKTTTANNGTQYRNLLAKVVYKDSGVEKLMGALLNLSNDKITIPELGMVVNVKAPNGGYFGKFSKKK